RSPRWLKGTRMLGAESDEEGALHDEEPSGAPGSPGLGVGCRYDPRSSANVGRRLEQHPHVSVGGPLRLAFITPAACIGAELDGVDHRSGYRRRGAEERKAREQQTQPG